MIIILFPGHHLQFDLIITLGYLILQISGNFTVAKDALVEIASRLRVRTLPDANAGAEPGPAQSLSGRGPPPSGTMGASNSSGYEPIRVTFFPSLTLANFC